MEIDKVVDNIIDKKIDLEGIDNDSGFHFNEIISRKPNLIENDGTTGIVKRVLKQIDSAICHTIGPYGTNTLVQIYNDTNDLFITRDGYTVMKYLRFMDPIPRTIQLLIAGVAEYMQNRIGDSTSSGIPISSYLYSKLVENYSVSERSGWKLSPVGVSYILSEIQNYVRENVFPEQGESIYIKRFDMMSEDEIIDNLSKVAGISLNNDMVKGRQFAELYRGQLEDGFVQLKDGSGVEDKFEKHSGFTLNYGLVDFSHMSSLSTFGNVCELDHPVIIAIDGPIISNDLQHLRKLVQFIIFEMKRDILLTAESFTNSTINFFHQCIDGTVFNEDGSFIDETPVEDQKPMRVKIAAIPIGNKSEFDRDNFKDFQIMTNLKMPISTTVLGDINLEKINGKENLIKYIENHSGTCEKFYGYYIESVFIGCKPDEDKYKKHVEDLNEKLRKMETENKSSSENSIMNLRNRIWNLNSHIATIYVGAPNDSARKTKSIMYDDAIRSMASAIKEGGVAIGGNISISHFIRTNFGELVDTVTERLLTSDVNISSGASKETIHNNVSTIATYVCEAFGAAYRYSLFNMYQDENESFKKWDSCISNPEPTIFNIVTNRYEHFRKKDDDTTIIVPITTDLYMMEIVFSVIKDLIVVNKMMPTFPPNFKWEDVATLIKNGSNQGPFAAMPR